MNKTVKILLIVMIIIFFILFLSYKNGYYIDKNKEKAILTEEMIKEYEEDLKNGVDVSKKDYIVIMDSYDNDYTRLSLKISRKIEDGFNKIIKLIFGKISNTINK